MTKEQIAEPLAKFHARVDSTGRIIIPRHIRSIFNIKAGNFVKVDIRHVSVDLTKKEIHIIKVAHNLTMRVGRAGALTIPKDLREKLLLTPGDLVEVILYDIVRLENDISKRFKYVYSFDARVE